VLPARVDEPSAPKAIGSVEVVPGHGVSELLLIDSSSFGTPKVGFPRHGALSSEFDD